MRRLIGMPLHRQTLLGLTFALLVLVTVVWRVIASWGLITVDAEQQPLRTIIASISKQGGVSLRTNLDPESKVTYHVHKVRLTEALDQLGLNTDARWAFVMIAAPTKTAVAEGAATLASASPGEDWKFLFHPLPGVLAQAVDFVPSDPRGETWEVKAPAEGTLQAYYEQAAQQEEAGFFVPKNWNPAIASAPGSGPVRKVAAKLANTAGGVSDETFFLFQRPPGRGQGPRVAGDDQAGPPAFDENQAQWMAARFQKQINKLPAADRAEAQRDFDQDRQFWTEVRALPPEQRRAKIQERMADPDRQAKRLERDAARDARRSPEQRINRMRSYVQRKEQARAPKS